MFQALLTYFAAKRVISFVVMVAMMIGLLAVVCVTAVFASKADTTGEDNHLVAVIGDTRQDTREYICFDSVKMENLRTLDVLGA